jgi:hypothetical protein
MLFFVESESVYYKESESFRVWMNFMVIKEYETKKADILR